MVDLFYESLIQDEDFNRELEKGDWIFAPIPLFSSKLRKRGYNQAEILAEELSKKFNYLAYNILERIRETKTQVGLSNIKRKGNIKGAFEMKILNQNIFLVDDVVRTGSTLLEASNVLKRKGAKRVIGLILARD